VQNATPPAVNPTLEVLTDLMPTKWHQYSYLRARIKWLHDLVEAWCTVLQGEASSLSHRPGIAPELASLSVTLQRFQQTLEAQAKDLHGECTWLYYAYATEYDEYVAGHYATSNLSKDELLRKTKKARRSFLAERASLAPYKHWPKFHQVVEIRSASGEANAWAPLEPTPPEPVVGSTLSVEVSVIMTDIKPEVVKASPMPESETVVRHLRATSGAPQSQPSPRSTSTMAVPCSEQLKSAHANGWPFLIPGSSALESNVYKCEHWPEFYQAVEIPVASCEVDAQVPLEPVQLEPIMGSTLSVKVFDVLTDNRSQQVLETFPMPKCETEVKHSPASSSPAKADPLQPSTHTTMPVVVQEVHVEPPKQAEHCWQSIMHVGAPASLIPSSLAQESPLDGHERTCSRKKPKEPDKPPSIRPREPLLSNPKVTRSLACPSMGSAPCVCPIPSASPPSDRDKRRSAGRIVSKTAEMSVSLDSPHPRVAPMLPITVPVHPSQAPSVRSFEKLVPRQWDTKNVVKAISKMSETRVSQDSPRPRAAPTLPMPIAVPARSVQAPSVPPSANAIP
jgi:hypothetical protein